MLIGLFFVGVSTPLSADFVGMVKMCESCHGKDGISVDPEVPIIAGFSYEGFLNTIDVFRHNERIALSYQRSGEPETVMNDIAHSLTDKDAEALADYFSNRPFISAPQEADEEQAIRYLVKYASKAEKSSHHMREITQSLIQNQGNDGEEKSNDQQPEPTDDPMGRTLIRKVAMKSVGVRNKSQQEIMHSIMQEKLYHSDFVYVNIHLDKYNIRVINSNTVNNNALGPQQQAQEAFYPNIFDKYAARDEIHQELSFFQILSTI